MKGVGNKGKKGGGNRKGNTKGALVKAQMQSAAFSREGGGVAAAL